MERLNWHMAEQLGKEAEVRIVAPNASSAPPGITLRGVLARPTSRFLLSAGWSALQEALRWRPHIVLAGSGLTAPIAWLAARSSGARAAVYLHGLDIGLRHPLYRWGWLPFIRRMDLVVSNSEATRRMAIERGVDAGRIRLLHPGVEPPPTAEPHAPSDGAFRATYGLALGPILLSVGRLTERKGLREFVRDVFPLIARDEPEVQLVVVGDSASDALVARSQSKQSILHEAARHGLEARIHFVGTIVERAELSRAYFSAAVHVFPVREISGDPEGFGMVAIEAAAHGLPTVAYATGGVVDAVKEGTSGYLVPPHDATKFAEAVCKSLHARLPAQPMHRFALRFAWPTFGASLRDALGVADNDAPPKTTSG